MNLFSILIIAVSLAMDAFAVSITNGIRQTSSKFRHAFISSLSFGIFQGVMPFLGWLLGISFSDRIEAVDHWIACGLLAFIGGRMIWEALHEEEESSGSEKFDFKTLMLMSVATSIDALAVGVSFAMSGVNTLANIALSCSVIAVITCIVCIGGFYIGRFFSSFNKKIAEIAGGSVLIIMGLKLLLDGLGILS